MGDREALQQAVAEFIGPFALIFLGAGSIILTGGQDLVAIALAHGLAIGVMIAAAGHISGGVYNPAITVGLWIAGQLTFSRAAIYIGSQLLGSVAAALALLAVFEADAIDAVQLGVPALGGGISQGQAMVGEAIATFFLMFVIFGSAVDQRSDKAVAPLAIGLTITAGILTLGGITGGALNPARHFGPALVEGYWADWFVWWIGPIVGAAIASVVYNWVLLDEAVPGAAPQDEEGAQLPDQEPQQPRRRRRRRG